MFLSHLFYFKGRLWMIFLVVLAVIGAACNSSAPTSTRTPGKETPPGISAPSATAVSTLNAQPTPTETSPAPLAGKVNGVGITLEEYQTELSRYQQTLGRELTPEERQFVLDDLINQTLLAEAAKMNGFILSDADLQKRLDQLDSQTGGATLAEWLAVNGYSEDSLRQQLSRAIAAAWMRDQIIAQVPETAEQIHARQILARTTTEAEQILADLQAGGNFDNLAKANDPLTGGDLGWFPRGFLFSSELEEAAFKLEPGQVSPIIQTLAGFHIVTVIEKDTQRRLSPQTRLILQEKALQEWIAKEREQSTIELKSP